MKYYTAFQLAEMRRMYESGMSIYDIGKATGITPTAIAYWLKKSGVKMRTRPATAKKGSAKPKGPMKPCIRCKKMFIPKHKFNRQCRQCTNFINANSSSLAPGW